MAVALVLVGVFLLLYVEMDAVSDFLRQKASAIDVLLEETDVRTARLLVERAKATRGVEEAVYVSTEEAHAIFKRDFGENAEAFYGSTFLPASIKLQLEPPYSNLDSIRALSAEIKTWNRVREVIFNADLLLKVQRNLRTLTSGGLLLGTLVLLAAVFLIANTIRLTIYARRLLIRTMKLVGATDRFIQVPFVVEGITQGLIAGLTAGILIWIVLGIGATALPPPLNENLMGRGFLLLILLAFFGAVLGFVGSFIAVRKFIKTVSLH